MYKSINQSFCKAPQVAGKSEARSQINTSRPVFDWQTSAHTAAAVCTNITSLEMARIVKLWNI